MILDAGVLVAVDRGAHGAKVLVSRAVEAGTPLATSHAVVGQVWRDGARQARLGRLVGLIDVHPLDDGRAVGALLARAGTRDVVDAHLVLLAVGRGEDVLTGDVDDLQRLVGAVPAARRPRVLRWP